MIDINIVKVDSKTYSIKTKLDFYKEGEVRVTILNLDEVELSSATSFTKLKTLWTKEDITDNFNAIKYKKIHKAITKKLISKYKVKKIII